MHGSSFSLMGQLISKYDCKGKVLDVGSLDINGTYRGLFPKPKFEYVGFDVVPGVNVDVVATNSYSWGFYEDFDICISGQTLEHVEFFWLTMQEMAKSLKLGGLLFLIAPGAGEYHPCPVDCWRFNPDGLLALARWAAMNVLECGQTNSYWRDTYLVATKIK